MAIMTMRRAVFLLAGTTTSRIPFATALPFRSNAFSSAASSMEADGSTGVDHVVLLRVKKGTSKSLINKFKKGIQSLHTIPGVTSVTVGQTFCEKWMTDRRDGYDLALRVRLESKKALKFYQDHELHDKVKEECVAPIVESACAVDWESPLTLGKWRRL